MAATHQQHLLHKQIKQFIDAVEDELNSLAQPQRKTRVQSLERAARIRFPNVIIKFDTSIEPVTDKDIEDAFIQKELETLEEKEIEDGNYTHGDEGSGEPRFVSHLKVKCVDKALNDEHQIITQGPDKESMLKDGLAADPKIHKQIELVSEGAIRVEERGYLDHKPTRSYHERVSKWMWRVKDKLAEKEVLECQYCGKDFEGKKRQKYCSVQCRQRKYQGTPLPVEVEQHDPFDCECKTCKKVYDIFAEMRMELLTDEFGDKPFTRDLTDVEKEYLLECAKQRLEKQNEQQ